MPLTLTLSDVEANVLDYIGERAHQDDHKPLEAHDEWRANPEWANVAAGIVEKVRNERRRQSSGVVLVVRPLVERKQDLFTVLAREWPENRLPVHIHEAASANAIERLMLAKMEPGVHYVVTEVTDRAQAETSIREMLFNALINNYGAPPAGRSKGAINGPGFVPLRATAAEVDALHMAGYISILLKGGVVCAWGHQFIPRETTGPNAGRLDMVYHQPFAEDHASGVGSINSSLVQLILYGPADPI